jgi:hypothetical protein
MGLLLGMSQALLIDATITFLGLGSTRIPMQTLGELLASGNILMTRAPWLAIYPGIVLAALASSLILIGYGTLGLLRSRRYTMRVQGSPVRRLAEGVPVNFLQAMWGDGRGSVGSRDGLW